WLAAIVAIGGISSALGTDYSTELSVPGDIESARGLQVLDEHFDGESMLTVGNIVFYSERGIDDPEIRAAIVGMLDEVSRIEGLSVTSPFSPEGAQQIAMTGPKAGKIAFANLALEEDVSWEDAGEISARIR